MRLNTRRTVLIGFAFLSICAFWQLYDGIVPLILRDTFHIGDAAAGWVMALDNILALALLPLFGRLSDGCNTRWGRRVPFIALGTLGAVILMLGMPLADATGSFVAFMVFLGLTLVAMGSYRSPAVALMPDVTPKPLRSKANAVINLMGALGGVYALLMISVAVTRRADGSANYLYVFAAVAAIMVVSALLVFLRVDENRLRAQVGGAPEKEEAGGRLGGAKLRSLLLILFSVFFWFMGYNAVTTAYTKYFTALWGDLGSASRCLMVANAAAILSYIPVGIVSTRLGRKRVILLGVTLLAGGFFASGFVRVFSGWIYLIFAVVGFAWAAINVNSYPMVVELSKEANVGRYTGYYYAFSMAAQIATPVISGWLLEHVGYHTLFPYAAAMAAASFFTMLFVRHGDNRPARPDSLLEHIGAGE